MNYPDDMFEEAARQEAANKKALESLGIDYENFGQEPWNESMLESTDDAPWLNCMDGFEMAKEVYPDDDSIEAFPHVTRVEVIGKNGREFVQYDCSNVQVSIQDDERTLKVFLS